MATTELTDAEVVVPVATVLTPPGLDLAALPAGVRVVLDVSDRATVHVPLLVRLVRLRDVLLARGGDLVLIGCNDAWRGALRVTGLERSLRVRRSPTSARRP